MNKASWYENYGEKYIENVFNKNVGYRRDEIYLTDKDSSLILLAEYWDPSKPLQYYIYDLMLAIELQTAKLAYLDFILHYMQANPHSRDALVNQSGDKAINLILQTRSILTLAQEAIDINSLIAHGFTRTFIGQLTNERKIIDHLESIERRVNNINDAIELKSSIDLSKQDMILSRSQIYWAIVAIVATALLTLLQVLFNNIIPLMQTFLENTKNATY